MLTLKVTLALTLAAAAFLALTALQPAKGLTQADMERTRAILEACSAQQQEPCAVIYSL